MNQDFWFKRKKYGLGWYPANLKGLLVTFTYVISLMIYPTIQWYQGGKAAIDIDVMTTIAAILTIPFILICYKKGEAPRWQWGDKE